MISIGFLVISIGFLGISIGFLGISIGFLGISIGFLLVSQDFAEFVVGSFVGLVVLGFNKDVLVARSIGEVHQLEITH